MDSDDLQAGQAPPTSASIQDLLNNLRASGAWAQVVGAAPAATDDADGHAHTASLEGHRPERALATSSALAAHTIPPDVSSSLPTVASGVSQSSVASLLSQLQASSANNVFSPPVPSVPASQAPHDQANPPSAQGYASMSESRRLHAATPEQKDFRTMTFQKSLSHVSTLAEDETFVQAMKSMKEEQDALERKLWEERTEILDRHEQKVKAAKAQAQVIGSGLSKLDADLLSDAVRQEMKQFEMERGLPAWDGLVAKHQAAMEVLTVPAMFVTSKPADLQKQRKVMQLVEGTIYGDD